MCAEEREKQAKQDKKYIKRSDVSLRPRTAGKPAGGMSKCVNRQSGK